MNYKWLKEVRERLENRYTNEKGEPETLKEVGLSDADAKALLK